MNIVCHYHIIISLNLIQGDFLEERKLLQLFQYIICKADNEQLL